MTTLKSHRFHELGYDLVKSRKYGYIVEYDYEGTLEDTVEVDTVHVATTDAEAIAAFDAWWIEFVAELRNG
jgi:hypothetical protein